MHSLVAYGHSWVQGDGASRPASRFVDLVGSRLGGEPTNLGAGGTLSTHTSDLLSHEPAPASRIYVVMTGLNDARLFGDSRTELESYSVALQTIFATLASVNPAALIVAVEQPPLADYSLYAPHNRGSDMVLDAHNLRLRAVAARFPRVATANVTGWDPKTMLAADTVHPNDAGHAQVARAVVHATVGAGERDDHAARGG